MPDNSNGTTVDNQYQGGKTVQEIIDEEQAAFEAERSVEELHAQKVQKTKTLRQAFKYLLCTASAGLIEIITWTILNNVLPIDINIEITFIKQVPLRNFISTFIGLLLSILWNFTINRKFTFKSVGNVPRAMFLAFLFYVPFYPFKLWFNGYIPGYIMAATGASADMYQTIATLIEICSMLINGIFEFCWQKFVIYRKEADGALAKYNVGEVGEFGEITPAEQTFNGMEVYEMMNAGLDINKTSDKEMKKWLKNRNAIE